MNNYDSALAQLQDYGLLVTSLEVDGRIHRCKTEDDGREKRGWYNLTIWTKDDGTDLIVGAFGIWRGTNNNAQKIALDGATKMSPEEKEAQKAAIKAASDKAKAQRKEEQRRAAQRADRIWSQLLTEPPAEGLADYLQRKQVQAYGLRYSDTGSVVVPMQDRYGATRGLQFILPSHHKHRKKTGRDKMYWPPGLQKQGSFYLIGSPLATNICLIAEGYATAATLHEATGLAVAVAFDAGNLQPVAKTVRETYKQAAIIICADDDYLTEGNPGTKAASAAAMAVGGHWLKPDFPADRDGKKLTDFNDLHNFPQGGLSLVRQQVESAIAGWHIQPLSKASGGGTLSGGGAEGRMPSLMSIDEAVRRFWGVYGMGGKVMFDEAERRIVHKDDVMNLLPDRAWGEIKRHPGWRVARDTEIGFDPTEADPQVLCNLFGGWPTEPKAGSCENLLELLWYLCSNEVNSKEVYQWVLKWLAYPLQHRGAKMQTALVIHGPQGTGKSRFFEAYAKIYGKYGRVLGQEALEDKFNADWAEKKLFILADEILARSDMYHIKNRLKGFITGDTIRVNPKNVAAHNEKNQMNIVFLSNERMPLVLENDDRRHCVIWVPPKPDEHFFNDVNIEIENGGVEALYDYLLKLDLEDFKPWTKPPTTAAKTDLIHQALGSEERFIAEWSAGEVETVDGNVVPFCPCVGSDLYKLYLYWCNRNGESRPRPANQFIGYLKKINGWQAGSSVRTYADLTEMSVQQGRYKNRKMVIPSPNDMVDHATTPEQQSLLQDPNENRAHWLTRGYFAFVNVLSVNNP